MKSRNSRKRSKRRILRSWKETLWLETKKRRSTPLRRKLKSLRSSSLYLITRSENWREILLQEEWKSTDSAKKPEKWTDNLSITTRLMQILVILSMTWEPDKKRCKQWSSLTEQRSDPMTLWSKTSLLPVTGLSSTLMTLMSSKKAVNDNLYPYVKDQEMKNVEIDPDIKKEYENQRRYLENSKNSLKKRLEKEKQIHKEDNMQ